MSAERRIRDVQLPGTNIAPPVELAPSNLFPGTTRIAASEPGGGRQTGGRFAAGNKASRGRPKGARDRASAIAEKLFAADITGIAKKVVEAAKNGESWACKLIIERLIGPAREAPTPLYIGPVAYAEPKTVDEARAMILVLGGRVARGEISVPAHDVRQFARLSQRHSGRTAKENRRSRDLPTWRRGVSLTARIAVP
jgi:hypothetical protein